MGADDITDPRVVPRWVEAGVSGIPRTREWDAVLIVEVPELDGRPLAELSFRVLADEAVVGAPDAVPAPALERLASAAAAAGRPPLDVQAVRRDRREWSLAVRELRLEELTPPDGVEAERLVAAVAPDGARICVVDGEEVAEPAGPVAEALELLELRGRERFAAFVAQAERVAPGRWELTIDPL